MVQFFLNKLELEKTEKNLLFINFEQCIFQMICRFNLEA